MSAEFIAILSVGATLVGIIAVFGALILTSINRAEARLNRRIDSLEVRQDTSETRLHEEITASEARTTAEIKASETRLHEEITASEARTTAEIKASETRLHEEIKASEARTTAEIKASEARTSMKFEEVREQFTDANEQLRTTNERMSSIERQQARLGGLLEGLREALFERARR